MKSHLCATTISAPASSFVDDPADANDGWALSSHRVATHVNTQHDPACRAAADPGITETP